MSLKTITTVAASALVASLAILYFTNDDDSSSSAPLSESDMEEIFGKLFAITQKNVQKRIAEVQRENMKLQQQGQQLPEQAIMQFFKSSFEDDLKKTTKEVYAEFGVTEGEVAKAAESLTPGGAADKAVNRLRDLWQNFSGEPKTAGESGQPTEEEGSDWRVQDNYPLLPSKKPPSNPF